MGKRSELNRIIFGAAALAAFLIFLLLVVRSPRFLVYDEPLHLEGARLLVGGSSLKEMLLAPIPTAAGPLFPLVHALAAPLTHLQGPAVRWVSVMFLIWAIAATFSVLHQLGRRDAFYAACLLLGVPASWVSGGMALTEMPGAAMASSALALLLFGQSLQERNKPLIIAAFSASGFLAGLAVLGRQIYLPIIVMYPVVAVFDRRLWIASAVALTCACLVIAPLFIIWGGILAPTMHHHGGSIVISHGVLSFGYLGATSLILAPAFYMQEFRATVAVAVIGGMLNAMFFGLEILPFRGALSVFQSWQNYVGPISGSVLVGLACAFGTSFVVTVWKKRGDHFSLLIALMTFLLAATPLAIVHLFSSRYTFAAVPFLLILLQPFFVPSVWASGRLLIGAALGAVSLYSYFWPLA